MAVKAIPFIPRPPCTIAAISASPAWNASRARERRAKLLAPKAAERQSYAGRKHGRGIASSNLEEAIERDDAKADQVARETKKKAAKGTGYSGTTLDKVDRIRDAAERGVIKQG